MKINRVILPIAALLCAFSSALASKKSLEAQSMDNAMSSNVVLDADVTKFYPMRKGTTSDVFAIDEENSLIKSNGGWEANFPVTNQFPSKLDSYSFKAHVENSSYVMPNDSSTGFVIHFDQDNFFAFYLCWKKDQNKKTIAEAVMLAHVNGAYNNAYQSALYGGDYQTRTLFTDVWSDFGGWTMGEDRNSGKSVNLRTNGIPITPATGFDMTLYVDRQEYKDRMADIMQIQVDVDYNGKAWHFYTPKYAIAAFTEPFQAQMSKMVEQRPNLGFWSFNCGINTYSKIQFASSLLSEFPLKQNFSLASNAPQVFAIDNEKRKIAYKNHAFNDGFVYLDGLDAIENRLEVSVDVKGDSSAGSDAQIGFTFDYGDGNSLLLFYEWGGLSTINGIHLLVSKGGSTSYASGVARIPWDGNYSSKTSFIDFWSDYGGFITDASYPDSWQQVENFNHFRQENAISIATGFGYGVSKTRTIWKNRIVDCYQTRVTASDNNGKIRTWYSPSICIDAFTYPNGSSSPCSFIDKNPKVGLYAFVSSEVTFSNFNVNGSPRYPNDPSKPNFGARNEDEFTFVGSDMGNNWLKKGDTISASWNDLDEGAHFGEVNALKANELRNLNLGCDAAFEGSKYAKGYLSLIPYYKDESNYFVFDLTKENGKISIIPSGKINGEFLLKSKTLTQLVISDFTLESIYLEIEIEDDIVNLYLEKKPCAVMSFDFSKQGFKDRAFLSSYVGLGVYNTGARFTNCVFDATTRIREYVPSSSEIPSIVYIGEQNTVGYIGKTFSLPTFVAYDYFGKEINVNISIIDPNNEAVQLEEDSFIPNVIGLYTVRVTATDEWGHSANEISYQINVSEYLGPGETIEKPVLWQTVVVLSIFGGILALTIACAVILLLRNVKDAKKSALLNAKNQKQGDEEEEA